MLFGLVSHNLYVEQVESFVLNVFKACNKWFSSRL
nr:MAG TPA: hypothetical protein [Caudoviricetes sp.]